MSISFQAMEEIDRRGFTPSVARGVCTALNGTVTFLASGSCFPASGLWWSFSFPDGSSMNIDRLGCSAFSPNEERERAAFKRSPDPFPPNTLW